MNTSERHAAPETEAAIRKRIIQELNERIEGWIHSRTWFPDRFRETNAIDGLREAIEIIERGGTAEGE